MFYNSSKFIIREWRKGDEAFLAHHANNNNIWKCLDNSFPNPYTYDDAVVFIEDNLKAETPVNFAIVVDDDPIGNISINDRKSLGVNCAQIELWISEEYWGQGIGTEVTGWIIEYCFENYNCITASVYSNNEVAKKVLINSGFRLNTILKDEILKNGIPLDELVFEKVR